MISRWVREKLDSYFKDTEAGADMAMIDCKDIIDYDLDYSKECKLWETRNVTE